MRVEQTIPHFIDVPSYGRKMPDLAISKVDHNAWRATVRSLTISTFSQLVPRTDTWLALAIAAIGLYAAFAHSVTERRREIAVRVAVGAKPREVLLMILREAAILASLGVLAGCTVMLAAGRWLQSMLFGILPSDPLVLGSAAALMLVVAALSTLLPALSASRTDPNSLLRTE